MRNFLRCLPDTRQLETEGRRLAMDRFRSPEETKTFMRRVFKWGGRTGARVRGGLEKYYALSFEPVCKRLAEAADVLADPTSKVERTMVIINSIKHLVECRMPPSTSDSCALNGA